MMQTEIEIPAQPLPELLLVGTLEEARALGARQRNGYLTSPSGLIVMSCGQLRALQGLKISDWIPTLQARRHRDFAKLEATLDRVVARSTSNTLESKTCECGKPEGTFACKIRHVQMNTGAAKAARD